MEYRSYMDTPIGKLRIIERDGALTGLDFCDEATPCKADTPKAETALIRRVKGELDEYFAGRRREFSVPLRPSGTPFQLQVWEELRWIPHGETRSYGEIAKAIGRPGGARAVGMANNRNPIIILIPCHRVIGSDGKLAGYAGGVEKKEALLRLEGRIP